MVILGRVLLGVGLGFGNQVGCQAGGRGRRDADIHVRGRPLRPVDPVRHRWRPDAGVTGADRRHHGGLRRGEGLPVVRGKKSEVTTFIDFSEISRIRHFSFEQNFKKTLSLYTK